MAELSVHAFTVYDVITRGAAVHRDAPAVIQGDATLSFGDFHRRVDELAAGLAGLGIGRGERICVLAQNDAAYLDLYGACARQGIIAYPINWRLTGPEVERVVERARPAMMVVDATTLPLVGDWLESKGVAHRYQLGRRGRPRLHPVRRALSPRDPAAARRGRARGRLRGHLHRGGGRDPARRGADPRQRARGQPHRDRRASASPRATATWRCCRSST